MLRIAVVNSGPLIALSLLGRLELLESLFDEFWIPDAVYHEVTVAGVGKPGALAISDAAFSARVLTAPAADPLLVAELDLGEAAVISLARTMPSCLVVLDEKRGRRIAQQVYGLSVKGTAGLLVEAARAGLLQNLQADFKALRIAGYYISDAVVDAALRSV